MNIVECLESGLRTCGDHAALIEGMGRKRRVLTYLETQRRIDRGVERLRSAGLAPGSRILLAAPFSADMTVALLAVLKAGMVAMFVDPGHGAAQVARCLRAQPPDAIVAGPLTSAIGQLFPELRRVARKFPLRGRRGLLDLPAATVAQGIEPRSAEDSALLTFTSGSTGEPKPVVRTHGFLLRQLEMIDRVADVQPADIDFVAMPMFVLFNLGRQVTSVLPACDIRRPGRADPELAWLQLRQERTTRIVASPALLERLAAYCERRGSRLPSLRRISTGGGPVPPSLPERLAEIAPGARVVSVYGSTEAEPIACIDSRDVSISDLKRMREGSGLLVGRAVERCQVRILRELPFRTSRSYTRTEFDALCVRTGQIGEIVVSGPHVLKAYADPARNAETKLDVDGVRWHRTGDAGYLDPRGRLWLVGRCSAAIRDSRGEIYPFQVEYAARSVPGVRCAALVDIDGRRVLAIETRQRGIDCSRIARCVMQQAIDRVVVLRRIPVDRRHNAKVDYPALRRMLDGRSGGLGLVTLAVLAGICSAAAQLLRRARSRFMAART
ncbi:MAG: AMP-binding protein [Gammaproteobacteria bacterium]|nr:AMP-binding protein [Gammaproteobacteria bacterium]MDH4255819.1 AMP-binding protein [Gammaproteobacteria bacterium]MDH5310349.1 AMP-binding protein [Gammaproteobacteria bacterium]